MRLIHIVFITSTFSVLLLTGCESMSTPSSAVGSDDSIGQIISSAKTVTTSPVSASKSAVSSLASSGYSQAQDAASDAASGAFGSIKSAATTRMSSAISGDSSSTGMIADTKKAVADKVSNSAGSTFDSMGSSVSDAMVEQGADNAKPSSGGFFSGLMVAVGLKKSPEEQAAQDQEKAAKAFAASQLPKMVDFVVETTPDANGDTQGRGLSTIFRLYPLQDSAAFAQIGLTETSDNALPFREQILLPNRIIRLREKFPSDAQFIGVLFQLHNRPHRWKLLIPVSRLQTDKPLHMVLGRCDAQVKDGLLPLGNPVRSSNSKSSKLDSKPPVSAIEAALSTVCQ
jgi:predicted component of type VI protein secretion system